MKLYRYLEVFYLLDTNIHSVIYFSHFLLSSCSSITPYLIHVSFQTWLSPSRVLSGQPSPSGSSESDPASSDRSSRAVMEGGAGDSHHMADRSPAASPGAMSKRAPDHSIECESELEKKIQALRKKKTHTNTKAVREFKL